MLDLLIVLCSRTLLSALWLNVGVIVLVQLVFWLFILVAGSAYTIHALREAIPHWRLGNGWRCVHRLKERFALGAPRLVRRRMKLD
jgi:hypothetical protein